MNPTINMYSGVIEAPVIAPRQSQLNKNLTEARIPFGVWSSVRCGAELIAGIFIVFYLLAALALTAAMLFYTFNR